MTTVPPLSRRPLRPLAHSRAVAPCLPMARVWSGRGPGSTRKQKWGGPPIHSRARPRSVVIRIPRRMINEAFWGPGRFLFCWGPEDRGSRAGSLAGGWEGVDSGVLPSLLACVPSRSSHHSGIPHQSPGSSQHLELRGGRRGTPVGPGIRVQPPPPLCLGRDRAHLGFQ